jgi:SAM-dependent methyltransferase
MPQVSANHYGAGYDTPRRFLSYWNQIDHVRRSTPKTVLEVGIGNGFVSRYLREHGHDVHTVDLDPELGPDTVASVTALPFGDRSFDVVTCFETLEHLPWEKFAPALAELRRASARLVLVSLPDVTPYLRLRLEAGFRKNWLNVVFDVPVLPPRRHRFDGQHYWEIGKRGYPLARVRKTIEDAGLEIRHVHRDYDDPFHRFFECVPR